MPLKNKTKVPLFFTILLLGMSLASMSYAHWVEIILEDGTIITGEMLAVFTSAGCSDPPGSNDWIITTWENPLPPTKADKDIGSVCVDVTGPTTLEITVTNAYPGYVFHWNFEVSNTGTIPWRQWYYELPDQGILFHDVGYSIPLDLDGDPSTIEAYLRPDCDSIGRQKDPGDFYDVSFTLYFTNQVTELAQYQFTMTIHHLNWNEWFDPGINEGPFLPSSLINPPL